MSPKQPVTAIFDIGKTNKKFLLFDDELNIVHRKSVYFDEITDDDGFPADDLENISDWVKEEVRSCMQGKSHKISAINVSAYGASLVHTTADGNLVTPLYNYLKPFPEDLESQFYRMVGGREEFTLQTASPALGMLNSGLQLYWLKHRKKHVFDRIETTWHLPQYFAGLLTGRKASELTSTGCHTAMWNFREMKYHRWMAIEGMIKKMPDIVPASDTQEVQLFGESVMAGVGIHDSSAALAPYLKVFKDPFIQLSTGTWSIAMNPFNNSELTYHELKKDCLQYLGVDGQPVKASRLLLGAEYRHQLENIGIHFGKNPERINCMPDPALVQQIARSGNTSKKLVLEKAAGSGPYPQKNDAGWNVAAFESYEEAFHQLLLDLASIQADALKLAEGEKQIGQIIITGGFAKNQIFCRLLATLLSDKDIYTAAVSDASALGAAVVIKNHHTKIETIKQKLQINRVQPYPGLDLYRYSWFDPSER